MGTSSHASAKLPTGCGGELAGNTQIMIFWKSWDNKPQKAEGTLSVFFNSSTAFKGYICGKKWYSRQETQNVLVICESCIKRLGWKW